MKTFVNFLNGKIVKGFTRSASTQAYKILFVIYPVGVGQSGKLRLSQFHAGTHHIKELPFWENV